MMESTKQHIKSRKVPLEKRAIVVEPSVSAPAMSKRSADELLYDLHVHQHELEMQNEELRTAHIAIEEARDRFVDLYDFAPVGYVTLNKQGVIVEINLTGAGLLGIDRVNLINRRFATLVALQDSDQWCRAFINVLSSQREKQSFDLKMKRADGSTFDVHFDCLRREPMGETPIVRFAFTDISEVKQLQIAASVFNSREGMVVTDAYGVIQRVNQAFTDITGYSAKEVIGQNMNMFKSDRHDVDFYTAIWKDVLTDGAWQGEIWNRVKGGELHLHRVTLSAVKGGNNVVSHYVGAYTDITDFKRVENFEKFRSHILELLAGESSLSDILEAIVLGVEQLNPEMLCSILLLDRQGRHLRLGAAPSLPDFFNAAIDGIEIGMGGGSCGTAASSGERVIVEDIEQHVYWTHYKELAARAGLMACWSQPIRSSAKQVLGTFAIYRRAARRPTESDIVLIEQSARLASIAVEKYQALERLRESEERFRTVLENIQNVAVQGYSLDGSVIFWNRSSELLYGYSSAEALGSNVFDLIIPEELRDGVSEEIRQMAASGKPVNTCERFLKTKDGSFVPVLSSHALFNPNGRAQELFCMDIDLTERKKLEEQVRQLAFYDPLTTLPNRRLLNDRLSQAMTASQRSGYYVAVMFLDLDNFKPLNDLHGHMVGDLLLIEVANRLNNCVRKMDTVARFGGDEFVVMISELDTDKSDSIAQAGIVAEKIRIALAEPFMLKFQHAEKNEMTVTHHCTSSIGVVVFTNHEGDENDVLKWADTAMYRAKEAGRNAIRFYDLETGEVV